jgi:hypothetical protein
MAFLFDLPRWNGMEWTVTARGVSNDTQKVVGISSVNSKEKAIDSC